MELVVVLSALVLGPLALPGDKTKPVPQYFHRNSTTIPQETPMTKPVPQDFHNNSRTKTHDEKRKRHDETRRNDDEGEVEAKSNDES